MKKNNTKSQFVAKRFDTKISTIEKKYDVKLGVRSDMKIGTFLEQNGYKSLAKMLQEA
jgi:hypothetical protein